MILIKDKTAWDSYGNGTYIHAYDENLQGIIHHLIKFHTNSMIA